MQPWPDLVSIFDILELEVDTEHKGGFLQTQQELARGFLMRLVCGRERQQRLLNDGPTRGGARQVKADGVDHGCAA